MIAIIAITRRDRHQPVRDYVIRSQVSKVPSLADGTKTAVAEFYNNYGAYAAANASMAPATAASIKAST